MIEQLDAFFAGWEKSTNKKKRNERPKKRTRDEEQEQEALRLSRAGMSMKELAESYASKGDWDTASKIQNYNVTGEAEDRKNYRPLFT